jgi:hypothetical protein
MTGYRKAHKQMKKCALKLMEPEFWNCVYDILLENLISRKLNMAVERAA